MNKLSVKNMLIFAVVVGIIVGVAAGLARSVIDDSPVAAADNSSAEPDQSGLFQSGWELAGEHDPQWLIEGALGGFQNLHGGSSSDPESLRSLLEAQGIEVPEGASTHDLQNLLSGPGGAFDHSR